MSRSSEEYQKRWSLYLLQRIFPVRAINFPYFNEALLLEMSHNNKKVIVSVIYGSFSQNNDVFDLCLSNFENLMTETKNHKPYFSVITGDFNARSLFGGLITSILRREPNYLHKSLQMYFSK